MGQTTSTEPTIPEQQSKNTQPIPSRESEGYKRLRRRVNEFRKLFALEDGFIIIDKEEESND
jgi:hypothetical protein